MPEVWKDVVGWEESHTVSSLGRVMNKRRGTIIKQSYDTRGYPKLNLKANCKCKTVLVHRLVAEAFLPNPENKKTVNHIDCERTNNSVSNLEWATYKENIVHAWENGLYANNCKGAVTA